MSNDQGESTNALFGFIRSVHKLMQDFKPDHIVAVFDGPDNKQSRTALYADYKSHRKEMPKDLVPQIKRAIEFCELAGIPCLQIPGVEADDTMGSIARALEKEGTHIFLCSSDKDLCQLVSENIRLIHPHKNNLIVDREQVKALFDVYPEQMIDYLAIVGDASDNIPGIEGFGAKTAATFLKEYGTLDQLFDQADTLTDKKKEALLKGKESALLSRQLATIDTAIPLPQEETFFQVKPPRVPELKAFYKEMRFSSLLKELDGTEQQTQRTTYQLVDDKETLIALIDTLNKQPQICVDTETTSIHPLTAELIGIGLCYSVGEAYYIPMNGSLGKNAALSLLRPVFAHPHIGWIGHHIKYDLEVLQAAGAPLAHIAFDTLIASYLVSPHIQRHNLDELTLEKFDKVKIPISELLGKGKQEKTMDQVPIDQVCAYCCEDVDYTLRLASLFQPEMESLGLTEVFHTIEIPLISVLARMETRGIFCDSSVLEKIGKELNLKLAALQDEIYACAGETFNISSPKQLSHILFEKMGIKPPKKTTTGFSTAADVLETLESPLAKKVLDYRTLEKLRSTYVESLPGQIHPTTGRIHCSFGQSVAATGRLSCHDPNLQNIPVRREEGKRIRTAFRPQEAHSSFISADYSQIELRLLAHFSEDPHLLTAFHNQEDIHAYTASVIFNIPLSQVTPAMRHRAKAVNFGVLYGQQAFGLSKLLDIEYKEAETFIDTYFQRYPKVKEFLESCKEQARQTGRAVTLTGRQRPIPDIRSKNPALKSAAERLAMNTPLQGTAADLIKIAMIRVDALLQQETHLGHMILQIHDELLFESPDEQIPELSRSAKQIMEGVFDLKVPLVVDISIGKNWGAC